MKKSLIIIPCVGKNENTLIHEAMVQRCITAIENTTDTSEYEIFLGINNYISFAHGVNLGLIEFLYNGHYADFDGIVICTDDMILHKKGWLKEFREKAVDNIGMVCQKSQWREWFIPMGMCYIKKEVIKKVGFLDERFKVAEMEDIDYSIRVTEAGFILATLEYDIAEHLGSRTLTVAPEWAKEEVIKNKERFKEKWKGTKYIEMLG